MANLSFYIDKDIEEANPYTADIQIEVTIDIRKYFDTKDFCRDGYTFVAPSGREFHYGHTLRGIIPLISESSIWFGSSSIRVEDDYYSADIACLARDINAFYEYLEKEKEKRDLLAKDIDNTYPTKIRLSLREVIPSKYINEVLPDFVSSNGIVFYYDTHPAITPVIAKKQVWFNAPEITDIINENENIDIEEIYEGFEEYKNFLKRYFAE